MVDVIIADYVVKHRWRGRLPKGNKNRRSNGVDPMPKILETAIRFSLTGPHAEWFELSAQDDSATIKPKLALPRRCTIRPAALFDNREKFPDVNTVMGRLNFGPGDTEPKTYKPFTLDPDRRLREVFFPIEAMPEDDWPMSAARWMNFQAIAARLLDEAIVPWDGLSKRDVAELVRFVPWPEPLEGCLLHALTQWTHKLGECVIEIGSYRGRSLSMLAMALRGIGSESMLISVDPHGEEPHNLAHCRLALTQLGEEKRLVQFACGSDQACKSLRPQSASLIFVDGNHAYDQVVNDFENYRELLAPGGCILFHDYGYGNHNGRAEADPDVRPAVDEHVLEDNSFRPLLLAHTQMAFVKQDASTK